MTNSTDAQAPKAHPSQADKALRTADFYATVAADTNRPARARDAATTAAAVLRIYAAKAGV